jgi:hypothetical protein
VIELLEPYLTPGTLIIADNTSVGDTRPFLDYVRNSGNGYVSVNFVARHSDSMEISCRAST